MHLVEEVLAQVAIAQLWVVQESADVDYSFFWLDCFSQNQLKQHVQDLLTHCSTFIFEEVVDRLCAVLYHVGKPTPQVPNSAHYCLLDIGGHGAEMHKPD